MFACQLPGRRASNSVLPPIDLTVRYGADIIRYRRDDQRLDRLPRGLGGRQRPRSKEAATVRRSVPGARRRGTARLTFFGRRRTNGHTSNDAALFHPCGLLGCARTAKRPSSTRQSALVAAAWPRARTAVAKRATKKKRSVPSRQRGRARAAAEAQTQHKHTAEAAVRPHRPFAGPRPNHEAITAGWSARPSSRTPT